MSSTSVSSSSLWGSLWEWSAKKLPRGFDDFFPDSAKHKEPTAPRSPDGPASGEPFSDRKTGAEDPTLSATEEEGAKQGSSKDKNEKKGSKPPPPNDDFDNIPGLIALLALVVTLRSWMEQEERDLGQEITFVDFRNRFLPHTDRLQIVNQRLAKVVLKPDVMLDGGIASAADSHAARDPASGSSHADAEEYASWESNSAPGSAAGRGSSATSNPRGRNHYFFYIGSVESLEEKLAKAQAHMHPEEWVEVQYVTKTNWALEALKSVPFLAFVAAVYFGSRGMMGMPAGRGGSSGGGGGGGMGSIFSIGRSTARKIKKEDVHVTFADVAGCEQAKMEVMEFVDFLKDADRFTKLGAKIPKGALLCGPPGTGKTLLARAVAGEAGVPFYSISGSDFIEMFVGVGPSRVRDLFKEARANAPCIIFIDEIDAVGRQRGRGGFSGGGNDERENTLNQLLVEMDGFQQTTNIVVLAGTNRVDILDQALTRPGRFDRQITVDKPDLKGRKEIFEVHLKHITLEGPLEDYAGRLAGLTPGFAGADIANICNEAAIVAARRKAESVSMEDFEKATDRIVGGLESNKIMSSEDRSIVAHHEAGHAIAGWFLEHADPLLKVTIIPRSSGALGFAQYLPKEVFLRREDQIMDLICMALAGRAAEDVFFGRVTTGASDDLRRVTQLVYGMIRVYGMNNRLGLVSYPQEDGSNPGEKPYSESTAEAMDEEARAMVDAAYERTVALIREHKNDVEKLATLLLEKETITHDDIFDLVGPRPFEMDSAYEEFVSHRASVRSTELRKRNAEAQRTVDTMEGGGDGLTPGLA